MPKKKRDSAYYKARLRKDYPTIHADLVAGRYPSVRAAAIAVGLIKEPSGVVLLKRAWKSATRADKRDFADWLKRGVARSRPKPRPVVDSSGRLTPDAVRFLRDWLARNGVRPGRIMKLLGFKLYDWTLAHALDSHGSLRSEVILRLEGWLAKQGFK